MKILDYIFTKILYPACAIFTVSTGVFLIFTQIVSKYQKPAMYIDSYFMFFALAVMIALSNRVFYIKKLSALSKTILHAILVIASIVIVFYVKEEITVDFMHTHTMTWTIRWFSIYCLPLGLQRSGLFTNNKSLIHLIYL